MIYALGRQGGTALLLVMLNYKNSVWVPGPKPFVGQLYDERAFVRVYLGIWRQGNYILVMFLSMKSSWQLATTLNYSMRAFSEVAKGNKINRNLVFNTIVGGRDGLHCTAPHNQLVFDSCLQEVIIIEQGYDELQCELGVLGIPDCYRDAVHRI